MTFCEVQTDEELYVATSQECSASIVTFSKKTTQFSNFLNLIFFVQFKIPYNPELRIIPFPLQQLPVTLNINLDQETKSWGPHTI